MGRVHWLKRMTGSAFLAAAMCGAVGAEVRLPSVIGSGMVIQRDVPVRIWGWADVGEAVSIRYGEFSVTIADHTGRWEAKLPASPAGQVPDITITGRNTIQLKNLLAGDVWVCSGQSNMEWPISKSADADQETAAAKYPKIRLFTVPRTTAASPQDNCSGQWSECSPATVGEFSAAGYFFGRELHKTLDIPIGLVNSSYGGTPAGAWTSASTLQSDPVFAPILEAARQYPEQYTKLLQQYEQMIRRWKSDVEKAKAEGKPAPTEPRKKKPVTPEENSHLASVLYNGMIHPITPMTIKGVIWYQGEADAGRAHRYRKLLPALIADWRQVWGQGQFPFGIVQLANYSARDAQPGKSTWAELREAQAVTATNVPNCGLVVAIDIGEETSIHPKNKQEVGRRLALWALAEVYGRPVPWAGPTYQAMKVHGDEIRVTFENAGSGLTVGQGGKLNGFAIAGEDRKWVWADARIDGQSVVVRNEQVLNPVAVRYGWANNPECNLFNRDGLPAAPFRTDDWPGVTEGK